MSLISSRLLAGCIAATAAWLASPCSLHAALPSGIVLTAEDGVTIQGAWARASAGAATTGAAYVTLMGGAKPDRLTGVSTPVAEMAEVHQTINDNGIMKMRSVAGVPIPAHQTVIFSPGGYHIMLMGLKQPLTAGQSFPLTLTFAHGKPTTVDVKIRGLGHKPSPMGGHGPMKM